MSTSMTLSPKGLYTNLNQLASVESGAMLKANNVILDLNSTISPRRGIKYYSSTFDITNAKRARQLLDYKGRIIRHIENKLAFDNGSGVFTDFTGLFEEAGNNTRMKALEFKGNYYITTNSGVKKISAKTTADITASSITDSGAPIGESFSWSLFAATNGFLGASEHTAYRISWGYKDNNNLLIEGVPSYQVEVRNITTNGPYGVDLRIYIPSEVTVSYFFRVYRCETRPITEALSTEFRMVFEGSATAPEIAQGYLDYTENLAESLREAGLPLYTNPYSGEGELASNFAPPYAVDLALFQNHLFYANTRLKHIKSMTLQNTLTFTSGISNFIVSDGIVTNTYVFQGQPEISTIVTQPESFYNTDVGQTVFDYFLLNSARNERRYFIYFDTGTSLAVPSGSDTVGRIGLRLDLVTGGTHNDIQVATHLATLIDGLPDFRATNVVSGSPTNIVTITNSANGVTDATADSIIQSTGLIFSTFQQGTGEDLTSGTVLLERAEYNTVEEDVDLTVKSLVDVINNDADSIVTALYVGDGKFSLIAKTFDDVPFYTATLDTAIETSFFPKLSASLNPSDASKTTNGLYFSKQDQPESVPLLQQLLVGSSDEPILRILPLRESLFIFKTDGIYRLSGYDKDSFTVNLFDSTAILKIPDSAVALRNNIYFFSNQGVCRVYEGGMDELSEPINDKLMPFISSNANLANLGFAVGYETDQCYMLGFCLKSTDTSAQVLYRYNYHTNSWVEWQISKTCAVLNKVQDKLYFGSGVASTLEVERKDFSRFDYADREITITLPSGGVSGSIIRPTGASQIETGDVLYQVQGVTIYQFNQLLSMLATDPSYPVNLFSTFTISSGEDISIKILALKNYLNTIDTSTFTDTNGNTSYVFTSPTGIVNIQLEYFEIIDRLNQSPSFFKTNYVKYERLTPVEATVVSRNTINNDITLEQEYGFLNGDLTLYKAIQSEVEFVPQTTGDPSSLKQFHTAQAMFRNRSFKNCQLAFNSDLSKDFNYVTFRPNSSGIWGQFIWGDGSIWGGEGDSAPLRTYVPATKQRCRFLGVRYKHFGALESYDLYGIALHYNSTSDRAYR